MRSALRSQIPLYRLSLFTHTECSHDHIHCNEVPWTSQHFRFEPSRVRSSGHLCQFLWPYKKEEEVQRCQGDQPEVGKSAGTATQRSPLPTSDQRSSCASRGRSFSPRRPTFLYWSLPIRIHFLDQSVTLDYATPTVRRQTTHSLTYSLTPGEPQGRLVVSTRRRRETEWNLLFFSPLLRIKRQKKTTWKY